MSSSSSSSPLSPSASAFSSPPSPTPSPTPSPPPAASPPPPPSYRPDDQSISDALSSSSVSRTPCPEVNCSFLSYITFHWLDGIIAVGNRKVLDECDMYELRPDFKSEVKREEFSAAWRAELRAKGKGATVLGALRRLHTRVFILCGVCQTMVVLLQFAQPLLLEAFLNNLSAIRAGGEGAPPVSRGYLIITAMFFAPIFNSLFLNVYSRLSFGLGANIRTQLMGAIFAKSLVLTPGARSEMSTGKVVNMMAADTTKIETVCAWWWNMPTNILQVFICVGLIIRGLGVSGVVGCVIVLLLLPIQKWMVANLRDLRISALEYSDERIKLSNEIVQGIRVIKFYSWQQSFAKQIAAIRKKEMYFIRAAQYTKTRNALITMLGPITCSVATFIVMAAIDGDLPPARVFSSLVLFNLLRAPLMIFPMLSARMAEATISFERFDKFMHSEELQSNTGGKWREHNTNTKREEEEKNKDKKKGTKETGNDSEKLMEERKEADIEVIIEESKEDPKEAESGKGKGKGKGNGHAGDGEKEESAEGLADSDVVIELKGAEFTWEITPEQAAALAMMKSVGMGKKNEWKKGAIAREKNKAKAQKKEQKERAKRGEDGSASPDKLRAPVPSVLKNINCSIKRGQLVAVVGAVGSGKSSLLAGLLSEMKQVAGSLAIRGSIGYGPQVSWIQNASVRENILFGLPFDEVKYREAVDVCCLQADIDMLPSGDNTEIGERGITLSGGQKQRLSLARCVYFGADIVLLDDVLSAVDAHVGKKIFSHCLKGVMSGKTRILVTHQLQYLSQCDYILFIKDGTIRSQGTWRDLLASDDREFADLINEYGQKQQEEQQEEQPGLKEKEEEGKKVKRKESKASPTPAPSSAEGSSSSSPSASLAPPSKVPDKLMRTEHRARGRLSLGVYKFYFLSFGSPFIIFFILGCIALQVACNLLTNMWLAWWTEEKWAFSMGSYMGIYASLGAAQAIFATLGIATLSWAVCESAQNIHLAAFSSLLRAPQSFFDTTPVGRIMNVFSKDTDVIDSMLADSLRQLIVLLIQALGTFVMIIIITPIFLATLVPILCVYYHFQRTFRLPQVEIKRLDSVSRSPLFAHFSETLTGLSTIRAYRRQALFIKTNDALINAHNRAHVLALFVQRWIGTRLETLGGLVVFFAALFILVNDSVNAGLAGLSLSYALQVTTTFAMLVRQSVEQENNMNSVERSKHYVDDIEHEDEQEKKGSKQWREHVQLEGKEWPTRGEILIKDLEMRYRPGLPLVLKKANVHIRAGDRVGVVGRTGSGKSSLMLSLFRIIEAAGGAIYIDGIDISTVPLATLRSRLAIIPQDPILYSGTIRFNLDPFSNYSDDELWRALEICHLSDKVRGMEGGLGAPVSENGDNFSLGEKAMICITRCMLRRSHVLVMDEATASIDMEMDARIQESLRSKEFDGVTVLTIAHRLNTVIDYDYILVMEEGRIVEYDTPAALIRKEGSLLRHLIAETGKENERILIEQASKKEEAMKERMREERRKEKVNLPHVNQGVEHVYFHFEDEGDVNGRKKGIQEKEEEKELITPTQKGEGSDE